MRTNFRPLLTVLVLLIACSLPAWAQKGQWLTFGHDAQRSGWARDEHAFNPHNVRRLHLEWKTTLANQPLSLTGLTAPLVVRNVETTAGRIALVVVAGSSDHLFALNASNGQTVWQDSFFPPKKVRKPGMWLCPNNLNDTPVIDAAHGRVYVISSDGRLHTLALASGAALQPALRFVPQYSKMWSLNLVNGVLYTSLSQDCARAHSGVVAMSPTEAGHPVTEFASSQSCTGYFCGAGIFGRGGVSADFKGNIYAATGDGAWKPAANEFGDTILKLGPQLRLQDYFTPSSWPYITKYDLDMATSTPVIFRWHGHVLEAEGGKEGLIYVNDTASLGGAGHHHADFVSPRFSNDQQTFEQNGIWGEMSVWRDGGGQTWLYVPTWGAPGKNSVEFPLRHGAAPHGAVLAFKVIAGAGGKPQLKPAWRSPDLAVPEPVAIAGGVVFALSTGENTLQVHNGDIHQIVKDRAALPTKHAVLLALDAKTGRQLWSSGDIMRGWTHFTGLAVGDGQVFVATHDGSVYAFGVN